MWVPALFFLVSNLEEEWCRVAMETGVIFRDEIAPRRSIQTRSSLSFNRPPVSLSVDGRPSSVQTSGGVEHQLKNVGYRGYGVGL